MKLVCFNVNGLRSRLHQLAAVIDKHQPDIIGLQETKVVDELFPAEEIRQMGYHVEYHGQKGHYGVCLISKQPPLKLQKGYLTDDEDAQRRMIIGEYGDGNGGSFTVLNGYFPQGENIAHEIKFPAKRRFYADLQAHLEQHCDPAQPLVVMGDLNISPQDCDIGIGEDNRKRWLRSGKTSFQPVEREWLQRLLAWGLHDTFRQLHPDNAETFSWFDYRSRGFEREPKRGLRIDAILATDSLMQRCVDAGVDYEIRGMDKPSDHAPIWAEFK
ncbi:exodeoxyribonuclease III [Marinobacterium arenosum]|uniref:exodeoxyribonuclease III n=1 Tax=Marinobacterium arenosum TaxID=2862496 RepID=UPI001C968104|nr:exodeoxyribonuclease III [Marinobacterium arenosum]MBY4677790.1 exodeoxyribonuclease III [Marinobacterium arenosum]